MSDDTGGRVVQINVSAGGVPKLPVARVRVHERGLEGDGHNDTKHHGSPDQAVSLFALEVIEALQSEGHPIAPGATGENLTIAGIDYAALQAGDRLQIGDAVLLELTGAATPCTTIAASFAGGDFSRIAHKLHPGESRWYARVVRVGEIAAGAPVRVFAQARGGGMRPA